MKGGKIFSAALILVMILTMLISCENNREHKVGNLSFTVPETLRATGEEGYDLYLSTMECAVTVQELNDEILGEAGLSKSDGLEVLVDEYFNKNKIDKDQCYLTYSEEQSAYKFRYSMSFDDNVYYFHYVIMIGNEDNVYFVDMFCEFEDANYYLQEFERWGKSFKLK